MKIKFEGGDLIGKTILSNIFKNLNFSIEDRDLKISNEIVLEKDIDEIRENIEKKIEENALYVILYTSNKQLLQKRLSKCKLKKDRILDKYDLNCVEYNKIYKDVFRKIKKDNILMIDVFNKDIFDITRIIIEKYVELNLNNFNITTESFEGESKKFFVFENLALVKLKPTLYSFTYNRYGTVEGTDDIRCLFWELFGGGINKWFSEKWINNDFTKYERKLLIDRKVPFLSNFLGQIKIKDTTFNIVRYFEEIPPIEVIWKKYLVGTMKHNLYNVDKYNTIYRQEPIKYEGKFPSSIVRFDWRNKLPHKDECIPDDFAAFYIKVENAKKTCNLVSYYLEKILNIKGYILVDLCYFMDYNGSTICSEITPDGMRIKKKNLITSFDKDLWRQGKDKDTIINTWLDLYNDLKK